jgi:hypothetical protein
MLSNELKIKIITSVVDKIREKKDKPIHLNVREIIVQTAVGFHVTEEDARAFAHELFENVMNDFYERSSFFPMYIPAS